MLLEIQPVEEQSDNTTEENTGSGSQNQPHRRTES